MKEGNDDIEKKEQVNDVKDEGKEGDKGAIDSETKKETVDDKKEDEEDPAAIIKK